MSRLTRTRTRTRDPYGGSSKLLKNGAVVGGGSVTRTYPNSFIQDSYGRPVVPSPLNLFKTEGDHPWISGSFKPKVSTLYDEAQYAMYTMNALPSALTNMATLPIKAGWELDTVAGTNPSRPIITIPEQIENIVQLPAMIRGLGNLLVNARKRLGTPKGLSSEYLGVQFGWRPLINDLKDLLTLQSHVIKRNKELNQLYSGKGLRRRLKFDDDTTVTAVLQQAAVSTSVISQGCSLMIKRNTWATIRWKPTLPPAYHRDDERKNRYIRQILIGATPEGLAKGLWAVIPWTWLIGWFTNFGKYALAHSWSVPAAWSNLCFMSQAIGTFTSGGVAVTNATEEKLTHGGKLTYSKKTRVVSSKVSVAFNMPYLDMFRLSIVGALFTQRFAGRAIPAF